MPAPTITTLAPPALAGRGEPAVAQPMPDVVVASRAARPAAAAAALAPHAAAATAAAPAARNPRRFMPRRLTATATRFHSSS